MTRTILEFLTSYSVNLLAFALTFHILLPNSEIFSNFGDSFLKVVMMLLGEFDFEDLNHNGQPTWMTKLVFLMFAILMSIVLINLVIGLSISDVTSLRKVSTGFQRVEDVLQEGRPHPQVDQHSICCEKCPAPCFKSNLDLFLLEDTGGDQCEGGV